MLEVPYTTTQTTKGFVCEGASIFVSPEGIELGADDSAYYDLLSEEIIEKTGLKMTVRQ